VSQITACGILTGTQAIVKNGASRVDRDGKNGFPGAEGMETAQEGKIRLDSLCPTGGGRMGA